ncbi:MAG: glucosyltransferase domain-containing protein [Xanthobacteraceae bacterium]
MLRRSYVQNACLWGNMAQWGNQPPGGRAARPCGLWMEQGGGHRCPAHVVPANLANGSAAAERPEIKYLKCLAVIGRELGPDLPNNDASPPWLRRAQQAGRPAIRTRSCPPGHAHVNGPISSNHLDLAISSMGDCCAVFGLIARGSTKRHYSTEVQVWLAKAPDQRKSCAAKRDLKNGCGLHIERTELAAFIAFLEYVRQNRWPLSASALIVYLMVLPVMAFTIVMADDWLFMFDPRGRLEWYYGIGRVGADYVRAILAPLMSPHYTLVLFIAGLLTCATTLAFLLRVSKPRHIVLFVLLFVMFPVHLENMYYKDNHASLAVAYIFSSAYLIVLFGANGIGAKRVAGLVVLFLCAILIHQTVALFILAAFLAVWLVNLLSRDASTIADVRFPLALLVLSAAISAPLYVAIVAYHQTLVDRWPIPKDYLLMESLNRTMAEFLTSFQTFFAHLMQFLFRGQHLIPFVIKMGFLFMLIVVSADVLRRYGRKSVLPLMIFVALLAAPWSLGLVRTSWTTYKYTAIHLPLAVIYPTIFVLYVRSVRQGSLLYGAGLVAVSFVILLFFQAHSNVAFAAKNTLERDTAISLRVLSDLDSTIRREGVSIDANHAILIHLKPITSLYDNGPPFNALVGPKPMSDSSVICGIYACNVTVLPKILRLLDVDYGGKRSYFMSPEEYAWQFREHNPVPNAADILREMPVWPRQGSLRAVGQTVFMKLSD